MRNAHIGMLGAATAAVVGLALVGTAGADPARTRSPGPMQAHPSPPITQETCPDILRGLRLTAKDIDGGVALDFTTQRLDQIALLRHQLREAARAFEAESRQTARHMNEVLDPSEVVLPPLSVSVKDIATGARVFVRAVRVQDIPALRDSAHDLEEVWAESDCVNGGDMMASRNVLY